MFLKTFNGKNLLRHEGSFYEFGRSVATADLWESGQLEFYLIADNNRSRAQLRKSGKNCFESDEDLEKIFKK